MIAAGVLYPFRVSVDGHGISVVASDGCDIRPVKVESFVINPGERFDFTLTADQPAGNYWVSDMQNMFILISSILKRPSFCLQLLWPWILQTLISVPVAFWQCLNNTLCLCVQIPAASSSLLFSCGLCPALRVSFSTPTNRGLSLWGLAPDWSLYKMYVQCVPSSTFASKWKCNIHQKFSMRR